MGYVLENQSSSQKIDKIKEKESYRRPSYTKAGNGQKVNNPKKMLRTAAGETCEDKIDIEPAALLAHFRKLHEDPYPESRSNIVTHNRPQQLPSDITDSPILPSEVDIAIKKLKGNKALGKDSIQAKLSNF